MEKTFITIQFVIHATGLRRGNGGKGAEQL